MAKEAMLYMLLNAVKGAKLTVGSHQYFSARTSLFKRIYEFQLASLKCDPKPTHLHAIPYARFSTYQQMLIYKGEEEFFSDENDAIIRETFRRMMDAKHVSEAEFEKCFFDAIAASTSAEAINKYKDIDAKMQANTMTEDETDDFMSAAAGTDRFLADELYKDIRNLQTPKENVLQWMKQNAFIAPYITSFGLVCFVVQAGMVASKLHSG